MTTRQAYRSRVKIPASYRTDDGSEYETSVVDISEHGCRLRDGIATVRPGAGLSISIGTMAPISAEVRWLYRSFCGVAFTRPLHSALVEHLQHAHARGALPSDEIPAR
ncbi:PilZ domain-containing protein [Croceicoccus bisphenolivorans]|uniref:PilZ domain-containing protein n=1 Tax=Croceicoccus bisphenolivorans TaxID=1783232 RepID=UPI00082FB9E3|nr:PilZ domain-containing protein [Croceicoccus bisphenolivorans]